MYVTGRVVCCILFIGNCSAPNTKKPRSVSGAFLRVDFILELEDRADNDFMSAKAINVDLITGDSDSVWSQITE